MADILDETKLCDFGCGNKAIHQFEKTKKFCCQKYKQKCPQLKKRNTSGSPYIGDNICLYGCGKQAKFIFKNGSLCCAKFPRLCPIKSVEYKTKAISVGDRRKTEIDPNTGLSIAKSVYQKAMKTKKSIVLENGLTVWEDQIFRAAYKKSTTISENGFSIAQNTGRKIHAKLSDEQKQTKIAKRKLKMSEIQESGLTRAQEGTRKAIATKLADIDNDGINGLSRSSKKSVLTKKTTIADGITLFDLQQMKLKKTLNKQRENGVLSERTIRGAATRAINNTNNGGLVICRFKNTQLFYQGKLELAFLEEQEKKYGSVALLCENIQRGKAIKYQRTSTGRNHWYIPDFYDQKNDIVYEIKSCWFWDGCGKRIDWLQINYEKLEAVRLKHKGARLVLDNIYYDWETYRHKIKDQIDLHNHH